MGYILMVEDDANMSALLTAYLQRDGFRVVTHANGFDALDAAQANAPSLVLLDIMLPGLDGWEICRRLRQASNVPIIMLTARIDEADRIAGLRLGADDYVVKPFSPAEVVERVKAVLRRTQGVAPAIDGTVLQSGGLVLAPERYSVSLDGSPVMLTLSEFKILETLMRWPGRVFTRDQLLDAIRDDGEGVVDRAVDVHIVNLRRKIEPETKVRRFIETVRGVGYRFSIGDQQ